MDHGHRDENRPGAMGAISHPVASRIFLLFALAAAATLLPASVSAQSGGEESLDSAVVAAMGVESNVTSRSFAEVKDEGRTQVNVMRESGDWAFGSAVIEAPKKKGHYPKGWLFVAENDGEGWDVALEGTPEFSGSAGEAPASVVDEEEKKTFATSESGDRSLEATTRARTGLMLPWAQNRAWKFTGGPHGWNTGYDRPYAALDFAGRNANDQRVRAAGPGRAYAMCSTKRGWVRVYHPNGYSTDYYHLIQNIKPNGKRIARGTVLGLTGNDVSCGGASYGRHVHFALLKGTRYVPVNDKIIGGWRFHQGQAYGGYAQHGKIRRNPGGFIRNYGP